MFEHTIAGLLETIQKKSHALAREKGFWEEPANIPEKLALIHSEVSEALECYRKGEMVTAIREDDGKPEGFASELADIVIRVLDLAEYLGIDVECEIRGKHRYNESRPHKHGKVC